MPVIGETVVIARPAGEVFDFLMLAENLLGATRGLVSTGPPAPRR